MSCCPRRFSWLYLGLRLCCDTWLFSVSSIFEGSQHVELLLAEETGGFESANVHSYIGYKGV